jgi:hypothetical protein
MFNTSTDIVLDRAKANALGISCATWTGQWVSPGPTTGSTGFTSATAACSDANNGPVKFSVMAPTVQCGQNCDRVLKLTKKTSAAGNSPNIAFGGSSVNLETGVELSEDGQTSAITGLVSHNGLLAGNPVPLSGPDLLFRKLPSAALDAAGNFLVVWEEENAAGTDDIIAARFNSRLEPLGSPFVLNDTLDGQQAEPWISGDDSGNIAAAWTSYNEDDELAGDIYAKVLDSSGEPVGTEFLVSTDALVINSCLRSRWMAMAASSSLGRRNRRCLQEVRNRHLSAQQARRRHTGRRAASTTVFSGQTDGREGPRGV